MGSWSRATRGVVWPRRAAVPGEGSAGKHRIGAAAPGLRRVGGLQTLPDFTSLSDVDCLNAKGTEKSASALLNTLTAGC